MEEKKWGTSGRMEHIGDVFPVLEEKKKTLQLYFLILIPNWYGNFKMISQLWNGVYFVRKPTELVLGGVFCLQL